MAKPQPPKKGKTPPEKKIENISSNLDSSKQTTLNFKVDKDFKKEFKQLAFDNDITMVELLKQCFDSFRKK